MPKRRIAARNPLVLIHGIGDTTVLFDRLCSHLDIPERIHCFNLVPNNAAIGLEKLAEQVASYIDDRITGEAKVDIVAFSMGGLVARYYVQRLGGMRRVERLITISTPHHGTWMAFLYWNTGARQMRPGSGFLRDLNRDAGLLKSIRFTSLWTPLDLMIVPASSSVMAEARSVAVNVPAHPLMMRDPRVLRLVKQALET
jgi:triacylglycerol lipase